jgi:asparagine synthase (glutamine-hydrolysing)
VTRGVYWDLPGRPDEESMTEDEAVDRTLAALARSVERRLVSDVPVGFFLSGGVDSSLVVAAAAGVRDRMETFAVGFDVPEYDERPYAKAVAERFGTRHHEFLLEPTGIDVLDRLAWHLDEPFADSSALPTFFLSEMTRRRVTVALSGDGGDELFAGYDVYKGHVVSERLRRAPSALMGLSGAAAGALAAWDEPRRERWDRLRRNFLDARLPWQERFLAKQHAIFRRPFLARHLNLPGMLEAGEDRDRRDLDAMAGQAASPLHAMATWQRKVSLVDDMLVKVDRMSMAHSLEVRPPFLDHELAELAWRIPFAVKMPGLRTKQVLKTALARTMPRSFVWREKRGFSVPLNHWFRDDLHQHAASRLLDPSSLVGRVISRDGLETLLAESRDAGRQGSALWALLMLDAWARVHGIGPEALEDISRGLPAASSVPG